ncbi:hypothetical protein EGI16_07705 [Chryseobacterium sp. G0240]|uniref:hypothetical protein n=1 Tax=Chryseobacterium sp. G0240 TaxID=2487066 RepID=UPI000F44A060|nr:hypothetical protein [Chryseobacterium sp. G0240]ROI04544.1 hypothetical protein EGI16_07705 [Chryseobacterium sp. G0240]
MRLIKIYYYFFYFFYKFWDRISLPKFWSDTKAVITLIVLKSFIFISILYYTDLELTKFQLILISLLFIIFPDLYLFVFKSEWKDFIIHYDHLPKSENRMYKLFVVFIVFLIIANFMYSRYWMDNRSKKYQTGPYAPEFVAKKRREDSLQKAQQIENLKKIYGEDKK